MTHFNWFAEKTIPEEMAISRYVPVAMDDAEARISLDPNSNHHKRFIVNAPSDVNGTMKTFIVK